MGPRTALRRLRRRARKTRVVTWTRRTREALRAEAARRRAVREDPTRVFIVAEKDHPRIGAPYFYAGWLEWAEHHAPTLFEQVLVAHMPAELPPRTCVLSSWIQDPVRERNEPLFRQLEELENQARAMDVDVVQPAAALSRSLRDAQYECLTAAGLRTPRVVDIDPDFSDGCGGLALPVIVRKNWGHQKGMHRLDSSADVLRWLEEVGPDQEGWVASEYVDVRCADNNYRKYRYIMFGTRGICRHLIVSPDWEVRPKDRILTDQTIAEELAFVNGRCEAHDAFDAARREFGFDIAAFDYSFDRDGEMVVWEVNPYPDLSLPNGRPGEYLAESVARTYAALADLYRERLAAARSARRRWLGLPYLMRRRRYARTS